MNIKLKALLSTMTILATGAVCGSALGYALANIPVEHVAIGFMFGLLLWFAYILYCVILNRLQYEQKLKEMVDK